MSENEQDAIIGNVSRKLAEARHERARLQAAIRKHAETLKHFAESLLYVGEAAPLSDISYSIKLINENADLLAGSKIGNMVKEFAATEESINKLQNQLRELGGA
jgi:uncharacterized coiled-coil protein SlyX